MKKPFGLIVSTLAVLAAGVATAAAQETSKVGVTMSTGTAVGLYVEANDKVAIRAQVGFNRNTSDYEGANFINDKISTTSWIPGASVLFFVKSFDATRIYVSPQYGYSRASSSLENSGTNTSHQVTGVVGAQHRLGSRFAVFAEAGLGWARSKNAVTSALDSSSITSTSFGTRSAIGGILFF